MRNDMKRRRLLALNQRKRQLSRQRVKMINRRQFYFKLVALETRSASTIAPADATFMELPIPNIST